MRDTGTTGRVGPGRITKGESMFTLQIETTGDAFDADGSGQDRDELARILRDVADRVEDWQTDGSVRDVNGNTVGRWTWSA